MLGMRWGCCLLAVLGLGCGASGQAWVSEVAEAAPPDAPGQSEVPPEELRVEKPAPAGDSEPGQVIRLGATQEAPTDQPPGVPVAPEAAGEAPLPPFANAPVWYDYGAPVYVPFGYGGYGYGLGPGSRFSGHHSHHPDDGHESRPRSGRSGTPPLGGDWAPPPSYGPAFPFQSAPGNPWSSAR